MIYPSIDKILNFVDSKYALVYVVAQRSKEIAKTKHYQMPESKYKCEKNIGKALEEVSKGLINIKEK